MFCRCSSVWCVCVRAFQRACSRTCIPVSESKYARKSAKRAHVSLNISWPADAFTNPGLHFSSRAPSIQLPGFCNTSAIDAHSGRVTCTRYPSFQPSSLSFQPFPRPLAQGACAPSTKDSKTSVMGSAVGPRRVCTPALKTHSKHWFTTSFLAGWCRKAMLGLCTKFFLKFR